MNYQQEVGYYEINPIYGRHPSKERVYLTKALEIGGVYAMTRLFPKHEKKILLGACGVVIGFVVYDHGCGIKMKMRF